MATKQYLDADGLAVVASKVNEKLKVVATMPATPTSGQVVLYVGATTADYTQGGIYLYNGTAWVLISTADVDLTPYKKIFTGTKAEWELLTTAEKKAYDEADLTDDLAGGELIVSDAITVGDLNPVTSNAVAQKYRFRRAATSHTFTHVTTAGDTFIWFLGEDYYAFAAYTNNQWYTGVTAGTATITTNENTVTVTTSATRALLAIIAEGEVE